MKQEGTLSLPATPCFFDIPSGNWIFIDALNLILL